MAQPRPAVLQMNAVSKRFGASLAVDGVDFELLPGEVHALMGGARLNS